MSWITDAQHQAEDIKNKKKLGVEEAINNARVIREQKILEFNQITFQTVTEIEKILETAKKQGLLVTKEEAREHEDGPGNFLERRTGEGGSVDYPCPVSKYSYGILWKIIENKTKNMLLVQLGLRESKNRPVIKQGFFKKTTKKPIVQQDPEITIKRFVGDRGTIIESISYLEPEIKKWLVKVFSEQK